MIREVHEVVVREDGPVELPMGILVEAGPAPGSLSMAMETGGSCCEGRRTPRTIYSKDFGSEHTRDALGLGLLQPSRRKAAAELGTQATLARRT
ncbi:hypothetical protein SATRM34S_03434 [Streptomyces atroolivaceus]